MNRDAENRSVVLIDELFESRSIALLCGSNQLRVIHARKIGFGGREHGDQASNSIHVVTLATSFVRLTQHVGSIRFFSACPFPDRQAGAISSARCPLPAKFSTLASTENSIAPGPPGMGARTALRNLSVPNSTPDSFLHSVIPSE